ncbi:MAG: transposase [Actinomycetia bacterium]|nr:transposase [Actinomycetes bacterium]
MWERGARGAFRHEEIERRAHRLAVSGLVSLGRRTVTGMIGTSGHQFADWSADYRLFSRESRFAAEPLFQAVLFEIMSDLSEDEPLVVAMDDSYLPKAGRHIAGTGWARDSHAPSFLANFIWSQRVLQLSAASFGKIPGPARMIPVDFTPGSYPQKAVPEGRNKGEGGLPRGPQEGQHQSRGSRADRASAPGDG